MDLSDFRLRAANFSFAIHPGPAWGKSRRLCNFSKLNSLKGGFGRMTGASGFPHSFIDSAANLRLHHQPIANSEFVS